MSSGESCGRPAGRQRHLVELAKDPFMGYVKAEIVPFMPTGDSRFKALLRKMNLPE
jgi:hypothetical protein